MFNSDAAFTGAMPVLAISSCVSSYSELTQDDIADIARNGKYLNRRDCNGKTFLFYARTPDLVEFLIGAGANPNISDFFGKTPLMHHKDPKIVNVLLKHEC